MSSSVVRKLVTRKRLQTRRYRKKPLTLTRLQPLQIRVHRLRRKKARVCEVLMESRTWETVEPRKVMRKPRLESCRPDWRLRTRVEVPETQERLVRLLLLLGSLLLASKTSLRLLGLLALRRRKCLARRSRRLLAQLLSSGLRRPLLLLSRLNRQVGSWLLDSLRQLARLGRHLRNRCLRGCRQRLLRNRLLLLCRHLRHRRRSHHQRRWLLDRHLRHRGGLLNRLLHRRGGCHRTATTSATAATTTSARRPGS